MRHSFSTCWNSHRHDNGAAILNEIRELGFEYVELGHGIRIALLADIEEALERGIVQLSSVHNFCPLPLEAHDAAPDCIQFSSPRLSERKRAVRMTCRTIDLAARHGSKTVVLHLGSTHLRSPGTRKLADLVRAGELLSRRYVKMKIDLVRRREKAAPAALDRVRSCLDEILPHAESKNVRLGMECRDHYEQIPDETEVVRFLDEYKSPYLGYWHDFGHAQIRANLGFCDHAEWLRRMRPHLLGCHLHDVIWPDSDHRSPFRGEIDYETLIPLLPEDCLLVWELNRARGREQIEEARDKWADRFGFAHPAPNDAG